MVLPESKSAPLERLRPSNREFPENAPTEKLQIPSRDFPEMQIPDLVRTNAEPEMVLPESKSAPPENLQPSIRKLPQNAPEMEYSNPSTDFAEIQMPDLRKVSPPPPENTGAPETQKPSPSQNEPERPGDFSNTDEAPIQNQPDTRSQGEEEQFLALSSIPALPAQEIIIPKGEARGRFAVSPDPNLARFDTEPSISPKSLQDQIQAKPDMPVIPALGTGTNATPGTLNEDGSDEEGGSGSAGGENTSGFIVNTYPGTGEDAFEGITIIEGSNQRVITYPGTGENAFEGITIIDGSAQQNNDSNIALLNPMGNSGEGIKIIGSSGQSGDLPDLVPVTRKPRPIQTSYSLGIISTENSGGGLPSYEVFQKDQIYTVYLDMRESEFEQDPSWVLEFGLIESTEENPVISLDSENYTEGLILPFPIKKQRPIFPEELVRRYLGGLIVINGIINTEGRIKQLSIEDSPDNLLSEGLIETLSTWIFRPAQLNGDYVSVKVLIGIPLWLPDSKLE
jgi:hypothetical protein